MFSIFSNAEADIRQAQSNAKSAQRQADFASNDAVDALLLAEENEAKINKIDEQLKDLYPIIKEALYKYREEITSMSTLFVDAIRKEQEAQKQWEKEHFMADFNGYESFARYDRPMIIDAVNCELGEGNIVRAIDITKPARCKVGIGIKCLWVILEDGQRRVIEHNHY